jgi:hypothetical protein
MTLFFSATTARRCKARSKRSGEQCRKAAVLGKAVCLAHGGASTGPRTAAGRERCAEARTVHGWEGRKTREVRAEKLRELRELEHYIKGKGPGP